MKTIYCRSCAAQIGFVETPAGKKMPVDPEIVKTFFLSVTTKAQARATLVTERGEIVSGVECSPTVADAIPVEGYVPHWITCTDPVAHRRSR